jgi:hypothetical protein
LVRKNKDLTGAYKIEEVEELIEKDQNNNFKVVSLLKAEHMRNVLIGY